MKKIGLFKNLNENLNERINSSDPFTDAFSEFCVEVMKETRPIGLLISHVKEAAFQFVLNSNEHGMHFNEKALKTEKDLEKLRDLINGDGLGDKFDSYKMRKGEFFERYGDFFYREKWTKRY